MCIVVIHIVWRILRMKTRDIDIRMSLHNILNKEHAHNPDTLIIDEFVVSQGEARIDVAVINGTLNGYEIKSESDNLERLPKQSIHYSKIFDTVTILTVSKFIDDIVEIIPEWWGIVRVVKEEDGKVHFFSIREAKKNPQIDPFALVQLLWRDEALSILKKKGLQQGFLSKPRRVIWEAIVNNISLPELKEQVQLCLKSRDNWRVQ